MAQSTWPALVGSPKIIFAHIGLLKALMDSSRIILSHRIAAGIDG